MSIAQVPENIHPIEIPMVALALRITVEIFRVLSQDGEMLTAKTIIDYFNATELMPLTICQTLDIFEIFTAENIRQEEAFQLPSNKKAKESSKPINEKDQSNLRLMMRTYNLLDFVKKYLRRVEAALKSVGLPFITKYCLEKYGSFAQ
jgi:hypothetical protein